MKKKEVKEKGERALAYMVLCVFVGAVIGGAFGFTAFMFTGPSNPTNTFKGWVNTTSRAVLYSRLSALSIETASLFLAMDPSKPFVNQTPALQAAVMVRLRDMAALVAALNDTDITTAFQELSRSIPRSVVNATVWSLELAHRCNVKTDVLLTQKIAEEVRG